LQFLRYVSSTFAATQLRCDKGDGNLGGDLVGIRIKLLFGKAGRGLELRADPAFKSDNCQQTLQNSMENAYHTYQGVERLCACSIVRWEVKLRLNDLYLLLGGESRRSTVSHLERLKDKCDGVKTFDYQYCRPMKREKRGDDIAGMEKHRDDMLWTLKAGHIGKVSFISVPRYLRMVVKVSAQF
jgi:hypothetical protein